MNAKRTFLATLTAALLSVVAWAVPGPALSSPNGPPASTPNNLDNPGASHRSAAANDALEDAAEHRAEHGSQKGGPSGSHNGKSHRCHVHGVAYVASGTLEAPLPTLTKNADGTYSGTLTAKLARVNHHALSDKSTSKEYKLEKVHLTLALSDVNSDGGVGVDDLQNGDQVRLIGKISFLPKKCDRTGFTPTVKVRDVIVHPPAA
jgi:hypothetical protein